MNTPLQLRVGMIGLGMIFEETYRPVFERSVPLLLDSPPHSSFRVVLAAVGSRTGQRAARLNLNARAFTGADAAQSLARSDLDCVCVATPDDRHFRAAKAALENRKHVLIEKPSVLSLQELDELQQLAERNGVLAKVVYHKLADPDHKKLRTLYSDGLLKHVNNGYCTLLEPKSISGSQFAEWIRGRNPGTYVAVHYLKLIDFTFGNDWKLKRISATGQRGIVGPADGPTWDSVQIQVVYQYPTGREAAFDIHTNWVTPDNFPGYVDQEVQFRFDNGIWLAHQRKRGVELTIEGRTPHELKNTPNYHYNGQFLEPWDMRSQRGYGLEVIERFFKEAAYVEFGGPTEGRETRLNEMRALKYNDLSADRNCVAIVQGMEAILGRHAAGDPGCSVEVNGNSGGLVLHSHRNGKEVLYPPEV
jgi:D-galacturonate reductase